jgi:hypothetical protein
MYPSVTSVIPREDYLLDITFNNGEKGILDMKPYLDFGVFNRIKDYSSFKKVSVAFDTIEWESGVDLDPEFVYDKCGNSK